MVVLARGFPADADVARDLPAIVERTIEYLVSEHGRKVFADTSDATETDDLAAGLVLRLGRNRFVTLGLDLPDQLQGHDEPSTQALQFGPKMARHRTSVTGAQNSKIALPRTK